MELIQTANGFALPQLETERLILRQRTLDDAEALFSYASLPEVAYPAGFPPVKTLEDELEYIQTVYPNQLKNEQLPEGYGISLKGSNRIIGSCDFNHRHARDVLEIGYVLHPDYWGQGYMVEAVEALLAVGFTLLDLHKVEISCYDYNQGSRRVAEKCGFTLESRIRGRLDFQGKRCDDLRYGLLKSEWHDRRREHASPH